MADTGTMNTAGQNAAAGVNGGEGAVGNAERAATESEAVEMALEGERFLRTIKQVWEDHVAIMKKMQLVLKYMVRPLQLLKLTVFVVLTNARFLILTGQGIHTIRKSTKQLFLRSTAIRTTGHSQSALPNWGNHDLGSPRPDPAGTSRRGHSSISSKGCHLDLVNTPKSARAGKADAGKTVNIRQGL